MSPPVSHLNEEELEQYCLGSLGEERCATLEEHLMLCEACCEQLTKTEAFIASIRHAARFRAKEEKQVAGVIAGRTRINWLRNQLVPAFVIAAFLLVLAAVWSGWRAGVPAPLPFAVQLTALRGAAPGQAPAGRPLLLQLDLTGLSDARPLAGEVVDGWGARVAEFRVGARVPLRAMPAGSYFVRIARTSGELLREYALNILP